MMKRAILLTIALVIGLSSSAQKTILKGEVKGFEPGTRLIVLQAAGGQSMPIDTLQLDAQGRYSIRLSIASPALYILVADEGRKPALHMMMEPGDKVTLNGEYIKEYNFIKVTEASGSGNAEVFRQVNNFLTEPNSANQIAQALSDHKDCLMSAFLVTYFDKDFLKTAPLYEVIRDELKKKYPDNEYVQHIDQMLAAAILPGKMAPDIEMKGPQGETRKLSDLKGRVVMIDFWASWCQPCRQENPNVVRLYHKYKDQGFDIFSVSMDKDRGAWLAAIAKDGLVWANHVSDLKGWTSSGGSTYGITSIPATVLIDRDGKVIARNLRGQELEKKLKEIFE